MRPVDLQDRFADVFDLGAGAATAPMLALAVGVLLLLVADIVPALRSARPLVFLGALASSFACEVALLAKPLEIPLVLDGTLRADPTYALWGILFLLATLLAWCYSVGYYTGEDATHKCEHDVLMLTTPIGMMLMVGAQDLLVFFVGLELLSIPLYALAAFRRRRARSVEAGLKYFLLGSFAAGIFLYGTALLYSDAGTLSLVELGARTGAASTLAVAGVALMVASVLFKMSVFPFHIWVPDVYEGSPTPVTSLMATSTKAAALGFLLHALLLLPPGSATTIAVLALATMAAGNLGALLQEDLKRMLAYSGVAHAGTLLLVVAGALADGKLRPEAVSASLFYMGAYVFTASGAFGLLAMLESESPGATRLESLKGLARRRPAMAAAMTLFMLSLGGIPATGGFLGKWFVFAVLVRADLIGFAVIGVLLSVVALGYYLRVVIAMYMQPASEESLAETASGAVRPLAASLATAACALGVVAMGVLPGWFLERIG